MVQHCELGKWLRNRYDEEFLPKRYSPKNIYVRSADVDRCISSALANLAGLYPPTGDQTWEKGFPWQPIPVHSVSASDDFILAGDLPHCPVYEKAFLDILASEYVQKVIDEDRTQIDYVLTNAGYSLNQSNYNLLSGISLIRDTLNVESKHKKKLVFIVIIILKNII